jgi:hypothetical protein
MIIAYKEVKGIVKKRLLASGTRIYPRGEPRPPRHSSEQILKAYYALECEQKFRSSYTKNQIKRVHGDAIQRWEQTGAEA